MHIKKIISICIAYTFLSNLFYGLDNVKVYATGKKSTKEISTDLSHSEKMKFYENSSKLIKENWNNNYFKKVEIAKNQYSFSLDNKSVDSKFKAIEENGKILIPIEDLINEIGGKIETQNENSILSYGGNKVIINKDKEANNFIENTQNYFLQGDDVNNDNGLKVSERLLEKGLSLNVEVTDKKIIITSPFQTKRLIVKSKGSSFDFSKFNPIQSLNGPDSIHVLQFENILDTKIAYDNILNNENIEYVEPDEYIAIEDVTVKESPITKSISWGPSHIEADKYAQYLKQKGITGSVTVAVLDSGVDKNHPFLAKRTLSNGYNFIDSNSNTYDGYGHGTHIAGIIADCTPNLNVNILPIKILNDNGKGTSFGAALGIEYATNKKVNAMNFSIYLDSHSSYIHEKINAAINKNISFVQSAGNFNMDTKYSCPSENDKSIVVSSITEYNEKSYFSNYGSSIDVAAPGEYVLSTYPGGGYAYMSGTSMAAPHITAIAAMYKLNNPKLTSKEIETLVKKNTLDLGSKGWDKYFGNGIPKMSLAILQDNDYSNHWAKNEIKGAMDKGWVNKTNYFRPNDSITRAEFIKVVNKAFGFKNNKVVEKFNDIKNDDWFYSEINIALNAGYITAKNKNFRPNDKISREEVASIITSITKTKDSKIDKLNKYTDKNEVSSWALTSVEGAIEKGYMGKGSTTFKPKVNITRAESVVTLSRIK